MKTWRNLSFIVMAGLFVFAPAKGGVQALGDCQITEGWGTTQVAGECLDGCAHYWDTCDDYCQWYAGYTDGACEVENHNCEEVLEPPPAAVFTCSCICIYG